jgi:hypothetical protein
VTDAPPTSLIVCAYRSVSVPTHHAIVNLMVAHPEWSEKTYGEAGINRARSYAASCWYRDTDEDVFLMLDDDIVFETEDAIRLVDRCRNGHDIIAAAYPFRDGSRVSVRTFSGDDQMSFGPEAPPHEVRYVSTGFFAVHRRVLDALIPTLPLCFAGLHGAFWPIFDFMIVEDPEAGGISQLSEDWGLCYRARELGFKVWLDRSIFLQHLGEVSVSLLNMAAIKSAVDMAKQE